MKTINVKVVSQDKTTYMTDTGSVDCGIVTLQVNGHKMLFIAQWLGNQVVVSLEHNGSARATKFYEENLPEIREAVLKKLSSLEGGVALGGDKALSLHRDVCH